ncbi:glycine zipper domain-containing protein [Crenobacter cavernae]|uniref:Glycine zipper domain-containing protein n=1 Tax=Crenobacter cavernae TaxID=2290923 RepID=A0A345Y7B4_9NEIS|nr:glycine zipper domain-containing protein [Crenobacter cavernae]AXK39816.1 hypothetical protein DWG20_10405 [Crenobacter cavernae]RXZ44185.1 hypothetical protein EBB06_06515 [Crenobacter cavernae]
MKRTLLVPAALMLSLAAGAAYAGSGSTIIGGALGGAAGAAIGDSVGGRNGAILGGAIGGGAGAAIGHDYGRKQETRYVYKKRHHRRHDHGRHRGWYKDRD